MEYGSTYLKELYVTWHMVNECNATLAMFVFEMGLQKLSLVYRKYNLRNKFLHIFHYRHENKTSHTNWINRRKMIVHGDMLPEYLEHFALSQNMATQVLKLCH